MNASDGLRLSAWKFPDKTAAVYFDERLTYKEMDNRVNRLANGMLKKGIKKGDKVAYMMFNCLEALEIIQALLRIGAILVPINFRLDAERTEFIINHCDATYIFVGGNLLDTIEPMMPNLKNIAKENYIVVGEGGDGYTRYEDMISDVDINPEADIRPEDTAYLAYTSGTTGLPKGVITSSKALMYNMQNAMMRGYGRKGVTPEDRALLVLMPLVHSNSIWSTSITLWYGGTNVIYKSKGFDAEEVLMLMDKEKVSTSSLVPFMLAKILDLPEEVRDKYDVSSVTSLGSGSAMLYPTVIEKMLNYFQGVRLSNSYGSSETGPATTLRHHELSTNPTSIGKVIPGVEVKVTDDDFNELPPGEVGHIWIKSDVAFDGYYKDPERTAKSKKGEWACAGDLGYYDEEGYFYLADRSDDMIISAGEHIAPPEVENILLENPKIDEVAVIGIPDELYGQIVGAIIKLREGQEMTVDEVKEHCRGTGMAGFKLPRRVEFVDDFPKTLTGKILKRELREKYKKESGL
ncbi:MAG: acyl--CoA ligase [Deltaproteobacteria bacterium]|nr:acyl--CoA ligase [Deltaproteobacteria bacterium]